MNSQIGNPPILSPDAAEDATYETFIKMFQNISSLYSGWCFITVDGTVVDARGEKIQIKAIRTGENDASLQEKQTDGKAFEESALAAVHQ